MTNFRAFAGLKNLIFGRIHLLGRHKRAQELEEELRFHLDKAIETNMAEGMNALEARRRALIDFGGVQQSREATRIERPLWFFKTLVQDTRYATRGFLRNPAFTLTILATLALGIGATTAVFSVVDRILFRSLPYADDNRLVSLGLVQSLEKQEFTLGAFFYDWEQNQQPFTAITFERGTHECNLTEANPIPLTCADVAQNFLRTLGVAPILGRNFLPEEDRPNGPSVALLSEALWQRRYNRDRAVLNTTLTLDNHPVRIVGVLPGSFEMPRLQQFDLLRPSQMDILSQHSVNSGIGVPMWAFGRLKPGVSVAQARLQMAPLFQRTWQWIPPQIRNEFHLMIRSVRDRQMQQAYTTAWTLLGAALVMLLLACANVAGLFLARGAARERELAVRLALGATRARLLRQTLTESILIALASAILGTALAFGLLHLFLAIAPTGIPFLANAHLDLRIAGFTILLAFACALFFGLLAALPKPTQSALTSRATKPKAHARLRSALVIAQIAISLVLLSSASLLVKSFRNLDEQDLGLSAHNVVTIQIPLSEERYPDGQAFMNFYLRAEAALRSIPGITAVGISDSIPPSADNWHNGGRFADILLPGQPDPLAGMGGTIVARTVTPDYFRVLQIPIVRGRNFLETERTSQTHPIILSQLLALRLFPGKDPVGQRLQFADYRPYIVRDGPLFTVIGVAANVKNSGLTGQDDPEYYTLRGNQAASWNRHDVLSLATELPISAVSPWIQVQLAQIDPTAPIEIHLFAEDVHKLADRPRFETALFSFFALSGLTISVIGLYGVIAYFAAQRTQEIGIRMALGANRTHILRIVASDALRLLAGGTLLGIAASLACTRLLSTLLFHVSPRDPLALLAVVVILTAAAMLATLIPARSAMQIDPAIALRRE